MAKIIPCFRNHVLEKNEKTIMYFFSLDTHVCSGRTVNEVYGARVTINRRTYEFEVFLLLISRRSVFMSDFQSNTRSTTTCSPTAFCPVRIYNDCCRLSAKNTHTVYIFRSSVYIKIWMKITKTAISFVWNATRKRRWNREKREKTKTTSTRDVFRN